MPQNKSKIKALYVVEIWDNAKCKFSPCFDFDEGYYASHSYLLAHEKRADYCHLHNVPAKNTRIARYVREE